MIGIFEKMKVGKICELSKCGAGCGVRARFFHYSINPIFHFIQRFAMPKKTHTFATNAGPIVQWIEWRFPKP
jgi:hypothetical protein